jgi:DNA-binding NtrC family response regulator
MVSSPATVVVCEANPAVLELVETALRDSGYHVLATSNPRELFELARRVSIDVLVGHEDLLDSGAPTVLWSLRVLQQQLPVVYIGGTNGNGSPECEQSRVLLAPFTLTELQRAVAASLGHDRGGSASS